MLARFKAFIEIPNFKYIFCLDQLFLKDALNKIPCVKQLQVTSCEAYYSAKENLYRNNKLLANGFTQKSLLLTQFISGSSLKTTTTMFILYFLTKSEA